MTGMRFAMLGSGSGGNGTLIQAGATTVLLDCGFMLRETERRLARLGVAPRDLAAIVVTHEHFDHIGGVARLARKHSIPVYLTPGTYAAWDEPGVRRICNISPHDRFPIGDLTVEPFPVPHDAREPCQFVFGDGRFRVGVMSDAGSITDRIREALSGCDALLLEFNHDAGMLANGPYRPPLKARIAGSQGHLSNAQAAELLAALDRSRLRTLVLTHLSRKNNTPLHARAAAAGALGCDPDWPMVADQDAGLPWQVLQ